MSETIECKVTGLKELQDELLTLSPKIAEKALNQSLVMAGKVIVAEAQLQVHKAPDPYRLYVMMGDRLKARGLGQKAVAEMVSPGWLEKNLVTKMVRQDKHSAQTIITFKNQKQSFFWRFLEFGTSKMRAYPFFRSAFEQKQVAAVDKFAEVLGNKLEKLTSLKVTK
jgi:HK97 gp10 family phage protein